MQKEEWLKKAKGFSEARAELLLFEREHKELLAQHRALSEAAAWAPERILRRILCEHCGEISFFLPDRSLITLEEAQQIGVKLPNRVDFTCCRACLDTISIAGWL